MLLNRVTNLRLQTLLNRIKLTKIELLQVTSFVQEICTHHLLELDLIAIVLIALAKFPYKFKSFDPLLKVTVHHILIGGHFLNDFAAPFQILLPVLHIFQPLVTSDEQEH